MKKIVYIVLFLIGLLSSCTKDVLDKNPLNIISDAVVWSDPILIDAYLTECYDEMGFINDIAYNENPGRMDDGSRSWFAISTQTNISDECMAGWEWINGGVSYYLRVDNTFGEWWGYPLVRKLNLFLEKLPTSTVDDATKKSMIAEARFLRAYAYFNMVKRYGGVPLIIKAQTLDAPHEELYPKRDKEEVIYDFILSEIDAITNDLQDIKNGGGRPTKYAALALKSRVAMYAGSISEWGQVQLDGVVGIPAAKSEQYWQSSYDASKAIISSGLFSLYNKYPEDKVANFRNIFLDENNSEVIFSEIYDGLAGKGHSWDFLNEPLGYQSWGAGGQSNAYLDMVEAFENKDGSTGVIDRQRIADGYLWTMDELFGNKDPRFHASIQTQGDIWMGDTLMVYKGIRKEDGTITQESYKELNGWGKSTWGRVSTPFMMLKHMEGAIGEELGTSKTDWIVFRYAETLLNLAEAAFELGKQGEALDAVNQIRNRAGIVPLTSINREKIRHERRVELAFEGNRYWDVRRWRTAVTDLSIPFSGMNYIIDYTTRKFLIQIVPNILGTPSPVFLPRNYYLPITLARTNNNPNLVENPGYQ